MNNVADSTILRLKDVPGCMWARLPSFRPLLLSLLQSFLFQENPFWIELGYYLVISSLGFLALKASKPRIIPSFTPKSIDLLFTSVSATTISSLSTLDMEVFSHTQLVFLTTMMFAGGEVFTSMLGLHLMRAKINHESGILVNQKTDSHSSESDFSCDHSSFQNIELGIVTDHDHLREEGLSDTKPETAGINSPELEDQQENMKLNSTIKSLSLLVTRYLLVAHVAGYIAISLYFSLTPSAREVLEKKGLNMRIFLIFTTVSTFANCGFVPTNENMRVFKKNSGLLLILIPQILMGNTLYPVCLRLLIWFMEKTSKRADLRYMLENSRELGYAHLLSGRHCLYLGITAIGFIILQLVVFCPLEWNSDATTGGLSAYQKLAGSLFQVVNSRHAGESVFDLSALSPAALVSFVSMMYLPPYTSHLPTDENVPSSRKLGKNTRKNKGLWEHMLFSQLTYLIMFIILICITERQEMKRDPLNFNVLNIVVEVISAYGNVGFSIGYSCGKQIKADGHCKDASYGFAGRWSHEGKFVLVVVMFFGRLKKFNKRGGRAWSLA